MLSGTYIISVIVFIECFFALTSWLPCSTFQKIWCVESLPSSNVLSTEGKSTKRCFTSSCEIYSIASVEKNGGGFSIYLLEFFESSLGKVRIINPARKSLFALYNLSSSDFKVISISSAFFEGE